MRTIDGEMVPAQAIREATTDAHVAVALTQGMLAKLAEDIAFWQGQGLPINQVGVNVSTADFYTASLARKAEGAFCRAGISLEHLMMEVSEDVYIGAAGPRGGARDRGAQGGWCPGDARRFRNGLRLADASGQRACRLYQDRPSLYRPAVARGSEPGDRRGPDRHCAAPWSVRHRRGNRGGGPGKAALGGGLRGSGLLPLRAREIATRQPL